MYELAEKFEASIPRIETASPQDIFVWVKNIIAEKEAAGDYRGAQKLRWELGNIITETTPGAEHADDAVVIKEGQKIIGAALLAPGHFVGFFVLPEYQRRGLGKKLMEEGIERLLSRGDKKIRIDICDHRTEKIIENLPPEIKKHLNIREDFLDD